MGKLADEFAAKHGHSLRDLGFWWWCRNTPGFKWLALVHDAKVGARYHKGTDMTFWWYLRKNFGNRHPWFYKTRWWLQSRRSR